MGVRWEEVEGVFVLGERGFRRDTCRGGEEKVLDLDRI